MSRKAAPVIDLTGEDSPRGKSGSRKAKVQRRSSKEDAGVPGDGEVVVVSDDEVIEVAETRTAGARNTPRANPSVASVRGMVMYWSHSVCAFRSIAARRSCRDVWEVRFCEAACESCARLAPQRQLCAACA